MKSVARLRVLAAFVIAIAVGAPVGAATSGCGVVGTLPAPKVLISTSTTGPVKTSDVDFGTTILAHDLRNLAPDVEFVSPEDLQATARLIQFSQLVGNDTTQQINTLQSQTNRDFSLLLLYRDLSVIGKNQVEVDASITYLDSTGLHVPRRASATASGSQFTDEMMESLASQITAGGLLSLLRSTQAPNRPIFPQLCIEFSVVGGPPPGGSSNDVAVGGIVAATVTLVDADGTAYAGKEVTVRRTTILQKLDDSVTLLTDANGRVSKEFPAGSLPGDVGTVNANYKTTYGDSKAYHVFKTSGLSLTSPDAAVTTGAAEQVTVSLNQNGSPVSGAKIDLAPQDGSLSANSVVTGADGKASDTMTMGDAGLAQVMATVHPGQSPVSPFAVADTAVLEFAVEPKARLTLEAGATDIESGSATPVDLTVFVGDARGVGVPVTFSGGDLSVTQTQTDEFGQAETFFAAPSSGSGSTTITAQATVQGSALSKSVAIGYHEGSAMTGRLLPSAFSPAYVTSAATESPSGGFNCMTFGGSFTSKSFTGGVCDDGPAGAPTGPPVSLSATGAFITSPPDPPYSGDSSAQLTVKTTGANKIAVDGSAIRIGLGVAVLELTFESAGQLAFHSAATSVKGLSRIAVYGPNPTAPGSPSLMEADATIQNPSVSQDATIPVAGPGKMTFVFRLAYGQGAAPVGSQPNGGSWHVEMTFTPSP